MPKSIWKLGGRITASNSYFFYQLVFVPGFGIAITGHRIIPIDTFWGHP